MPGDAEAAVSHLRRADPVMATLVDLVGPPQLRAADPDPFRALTRAIVYQQLSGRAAGTIHGRLCALFPGGEPEPGGIMSATDEALRGVGLSRQKTAALRDLAAHALTGELTLENVEGWSDDEVIQHLTRVRGVGRWTAEMYLMFSLRRPDVLPVDDLGINRAIMQLYALPALPRPAEVLRIGSPWRPYATYACWYLWRSQDMTPPAPPV